MKTTFTYKPMSLISSNVPDYNSLGWYLRNLQNKLHPVLDDSKRELLNDPLVIELIQQTWDEAIDIGRDLGYEDGYDDGSWEHCNEDYD